MLQQEISEIFILNLVRSKFKTISIIGSAPGFGLSITKLFFSVNPELLLINVKLDQQKKA
jgi:hypothetical protein